MRQEALIELRDTQKGNIAVPIEEWDEVELIHSPAIILDEESVRNDTVVELSDVRSIPIPVVSPVHEVFIRVLDIIGSVVMLFLAAPIMFLAAVLIKISSEGPVLFKQRRVGRNNEIYVLYKFRTMINGAERHTGPVWATKEDGRVTPIGRILRSMRLDELPQLYNVLRGDMSLVGPRPERPYFVSRHRALQGIRLAVKPGITGLAQVRGHYNLKPEHKLKYDCLYIQKRSCLLNLYILLQTIPVIFLKKGW